MRREHCASANPCLRSAMVYNGFTYHIMVTALTHDWQTAVTHRQSAPDSERGLSPEWDISRSHLNVYRDPAVYLSIYYCHLSIRYYQNEKSCSMMNLSPIILFNIVKHYMCGRVLAITVLQTQRITVRIYSRATNERVLRRINHSWLKIAQ
jgi:hypothetical protein